MQNLEKILIIGFGSIGKKHARIINQFWPKTEISIVSSTLNNSHYRLSYISNKFESIKQGLIWRPDCAIISSPSSFHLEQALILSRANIPILIEKPIGNGKENIKLWEELLSLSKKVPVMIGYVFRHDDCINHFKNRKFNKRVPDFLREQEDNLNTLRNLSRTILRGNSIIKNVKSGVFPGKY